MISKLRIPIIQLQLSNYDIQLKDGVIYVLLKNVHFKNISIDF